MLVDDEGGDLVLFEPWLLSSLVKLGRGIWESKNGVREDWTGWPEKLGKLTDRLACPSNVLRAKADLYNKNSL